MKRGAACVPMAAETVGTRRPSRPGPFRSGTTLALGVPRAGRVTARVYDVAGRVVRTIEDSHREAGVGVLEWDGTNGDGEAVASGVYFVRVTAAGSDRTRKVVLLK